MNLEVSISEAIGTMDLFGQPYNLARRSLPDLLAQSHDPLSDGTLAVDVPELMVVRDNLGTYKRWFNGTKYFYTVKATPPTRE